MKRVDTYEIYSDHVHAVISSLHTDQNRQISQKCFYITTCVPLSVVSSKLQTQYIELTVDKELNNPSRLNQ